MSCLWLYKVFCSVGHLLSKMFHYESSFRKPLWIVRAGDRMALQNKTLSGLMSEYEWIMHDLTLKGDLA